MSYSPEIQMTKTGIIHRPTEIQKDKRREWENRKIKRHWKIVFGERKGKDAVIFFITELTPPIDFYARYIKNEVVKSLFIAIKKRNCTAHKKLESKRGTIHHMLPKSRQKEIHVSESEGNKKENLIRLNQRVHRSINFLFGGNSTPEEIIIYLLRLCLQVPFIEKEGVESEFFINLGSNDSCENIAL